jgi:hypothetical protein
MEKILIITIIGALASTASGLKRWCSNLTTSVDFNRDNTQITEISYYNISSSVQGDLDTTLNTFTMNVMYSLTPFPNSVPFSCPSTRYKGISTSTKPFMPLNNYTASVEALLLSIDNYNFYETIAFIIPNCFFQFINHTARCYITPTNIISRIPDNCNTVGNAIVTFGMTYYEIDFNYTMDLSDSLPCRVTPYTCGYTIEPVYNSSCCILNGTLYQDISFYSTSEFSFDSFTRTCYAPPFWDTWKILVICFAGIIVIILFAGVAHWCLKSDNSYIKT